MQRFEAYLEANIPSVESFHPHYNEAIKQILTAGGKRFRPQLLLSIVKSHTPMLYDSALPVALAIEMLHTYSLIHDDLPAMDDAALRRGKPTLHIAYDEVSAILVGDALNTEAFYALAKAPLRDDVKVALVTELSKAGGLGGMVHGQALDCHFENQKLSLEQVKLLHTDKTAKLIAASLKMGAIVASLSKQEQEELYSFGLDLGLLFQIQDDILDLTQSDEEAGKTTQNDEGKNSFVTLLGLEGAIKEADSLSDSLTKRLDGFDSKTKEALVTIKHYLNRHKN